MNSLMPYLEKMSSMQGSDLFITVGKPVCMKHHGTIQDLDENILDEDHAKNLIFSMMNEPQIDEFKNSHELNFAIATENIGRYRVNVFLQRSCIGAVIRRIETNIPTLEDLDMPNVINDFSMLKRGLVILVGATGAGKSSTLAAMIGYRNKSQSGHIVTIEDPIEFVHEHKKCIVTQREVGLDTDSFEIALKNTLRQAPDIILIGEIRDAKTMEYAIAFSETGHLCLATLHANGANQALDRIINFFPETKHRQIWTDLSFNLKAVVAQQLIPRTDKPGRIPAVEILTNAPVIQEAIKNGEVHELKDQMKKDTEFGMQTFDQSLFEHYKNNKISYENALKHAVSENELRLMIKLSRNEDSNGLDDVKLQD